MALELSPGEPRKGVEKHGVMDVLQKGLKLFEKGCSTRGWWSVNIQKVEDSLFRDILMRKFSKVEQSIVGTRDAFSPSLTKNPSPPPRRVSRGC